MAALTDADLKSFVAAVLSTTAGAADLPAYWDALIPAANADAKNRIFSALQGRGYLPAQVEVWDRYAEFNRRIALWLLSLDHRIENADGLTEASRKMEDWAKELATITILVSGAYMAPLAAPVRRWGVMSNAGMMFPVPRRLYGPNALPADTAGVTAADTAAAASGLSDAGIGLSDAGVPLTGGG